MLRDVSGRVGALHRAGWAHRDLKPGIIMYLPTRLTWVLIDFGVSARIGKAACVRGTALYAAPELAAAYLNGDSSIYTTAALDAWSLGIIALELMLGYPPLGALSDQDSVRSRCSCVVVELHETSKASPVFCVRCFVKEYCPTVSVGQLL